MKTKHKVLDKELWLLLLMDQIWEHERTLGSQQVLKTCTVVGQQSPFSAASLNINACKANPMGLLMRANMVHPIQLV